MLAGSGKVGEAAAIVDAASDPAGAAFEGGPTTDIQYEVAAASRLVGIMHDVAAPAAGAYVRGLMVGAVARIDRAHKAPGDAALAIALDVCGRLSGDDGPASRLGSLRAVEEHRRLSEVLAAHRLRFWGAAKETLIGRDLANFRECGTSLFTSVQPEFVRLVDGLLVEGRATSHPTADAAILAHHGTHRAQALPAPIAVEGVSTRDPHALVARARALQDFEWSHFPPREATMRTAVSDIVGLVARIEADRRVMAEAADRAGGVDSDMLASINSTAWLEAKRKVMRRDAGRTAGDDPARLESIEASGMYHWLPDERQEEIYGRIQRTHGVAPSVLIEQASSAVAVFIERQALARDAAAMRRMVISEGRRLVDVGV